MTGCRRPPGRLRAAAAAVALGVGLLAVTAAGAAGSLPDASQLLEWVRELSEPAMEGRAAGTPGADRAAAHLAAHFGRLGLRPAGDAGGYLQRFDVLTGVRLGAGSTLEIRTAGSARAFVPEQGFLPLPVSEDGDVTAEVIFAGYGITALPLGYDDYAGLDVRGKVVLVSTGEPREASPQAPSAPPSTSTTPSCATRC